MAPSSDALSPHQSPPPSASVSTFSRPRSLHSNHRPSAIKTVVTAPRTSRRVARSSLHPRAHLSVFLLAWARDEPPSPGDEVPPSAPQDQCNLSSLVRPSEHRPSDVTSYQSSAGDDNLAGPSRWWAFTRQRPEDHSASQPLTSSAARLGFNRSRALSVNWLPASLSRRPGDHELATSRDREIVEEEGEEFRPPGRLHLELPLPTHSPQTLAQTKTPGWDIPWSPRIPGQVSSSWDTTVHDSDHEKDERENRWKKRARVYMLTNVYVPLVSYSATSLGLPLTSSYSFSGL